MRSKKGISPVIATVLLVALVLVLVAIIFIWARGFISESVQKGGVSVSEVCKDVKIETSSTVSPSGGSVEVQIVNRGNIPIYQFEVKLDAGSSASQGNYNTPLDVGSSAILSVPTQPGVKLIIYPVILGTVAGKSSNKAYTCLENGEALNV